MTGLIPLEQWAQKVGKSARWARDHANAGHILTVKIGGSHFLTDELIAAMSARAIPTAVQDLAREGQESADDGWGQITRSAS